MNLIPVDPTNALAVSDYLTRARDWLATAVERTGPAEIANAKAEIATAAEATKQLGLSKEIQDDAKEMVRRAEYALGKAVRQGQEKGLIAIRGQHIDRDVPGGTSSVDDFFGTRGRESAETFAMADLEPEEFDAAIEAARAEDNLSRANVARKAAEQSGKPERARPRRALPDQFFDAAYDLTKVAERIDRLVADDRFPQNAEKVGAKHRTDLLRAVELLTRALDNFPNN